MANFDEEIRKHENIINNLNEKINNNLNNEEKIYDLEKIKLEQEFIISLIKLWINNNIKEQSKSKDIKENNESNKKYIKSKSFPKQKMKK